ncbi:MAG: GNAT family N-acetyltransferase, partial [Armatimonadetes bacterium]|nr:GNAT family N-acetyltransferase [Anaerolineae bacterium]
NIPTIPNIIAPTAADAVKAAEQVGYPVVLKLHSETITHKTDVGGVLLNITDAEGVRRGYEAIQTSVQQKVGSGHFLGVAVQPMVKLEGYELIIGSSVDSQFGPVLLFGSGGTLVEVFKDRALGLPPLNTTLARRMMEQTKIYTALQGVRGRKGVDLAALEKIMVRFSQLVVEQPWIKEIDINPLVASPERLLALDARVVLHDPATPVADLPKPAIRPYPTQYVQNWTAKDGETILIRPIRPEDEPLLVKFHERLSERTVYMRFFSPLNLGQRVAHERLSRIAFIDYNQEMALVPTRMNPESGEPEILGAGRLIKEHGRREAEFSLLITDDFQGKGLGRELLARLVGIGRDEGLQRIHGYVLPENTGMLKVCEDLGFKQHYDAQENVVKVTLEL